MRTFTAFGATCIAGCLFASFAQVAQPVRNALESNQYDLATDGRAFLLAEGSKAHLFLLGELHGENEVPALIRSVWPELWKSGYRHVAAEVSPWTATRLEFGGGAEFKLRSLWTRAEAAFVTGLKATDDSQPVLWGCDMEEVRPDLLIADLAAANPTDPALLTAVSMTKAGYERKSAPELLRAVRAAVGARDVSVGGRSLVGSIVESLEIDSLRLSGDRFAASNRREALMKEIFYGRWGSSGRPKALLRFGRNHLHRGYDRRGVSTLGNFAAELASAHGLSTFNVAVFSGGGKIRATEGTVVWDERGDDPAFAYLASIARHAATVFDLRAIRPALHRIPEGKRSPTELSLLYWADSYDAVLYYRTVTPIAAGGQAMNHKRVYRLYCDEEPAAPQTAEEGAAPGACRTDAGAAVNERWALDFVSDTLANGRGFRETKSAIPF